MVDSDRVSCIFGSFSRRKPSQDVANKRKFVHDRSKSAPHQTKKDIHLTQRSKTVYIDNNIGVSEQFTCPVCREVFVETRVLPCLHTFCLNCVLKMENAIKKSKPGKSESRLHKKKQVDDNSNISLKVSCPICNYKSELPLEGATVLPPNYILQHKMVLATMNSKNSHLLCDLCISDTSAISRCMDCAINFCQECEEMHLRQKFSAAHEVLSLEKAREKGITKVRRRIMCSKHPDLELSLFCNTCLEVICQDCIIFHKDHTCDSVSRAADSKFNHLRSTIHQTKYLITESSKEVTRLNDASRLIEDHCNDIQEEVERFMDEYLRAVENHKHKLLEKIRLFKKSKLDYILEEKIRLQKKLRDARDLSYFLGDLLNDGADAEILSFLKPIMKKMKQCEISQKLLPSNLLGNIQFLKDEIVEVPKHNFKLHGALKTHAVAPEQCGNSGALQELQIGKKVEILLEVKDGNSCLVSSGEDTVQVKTLNKTNDVIDLEPMEVSNNRNGTYSIMVVPKIAGKYALHVQIDNKPTHGSPHIFSVPPRNSHKGTYHCCSFCSSGGSKHGTPCGCGGHMPGGYKGCGHGHEGHPGQWHWSCCGSIGEYSECGLKHYQFTL